MHHDLHTTQASCNTHAMKLLIVESPAKAKTISKYLGKDYEVVASVGHVRDLPKSNKKAIDIPGGFIPHYEISAGKEKVVTEIKGLAKKAQEVLIATDPDREGEAIAWHLSELIKQPASKVKRVVYHEITKEAIEEALKHPRKIDENLRMAQEARRVLDRLVGYDLSGLIWKKVRYGLSAGRVQSPALRIIMEREREIRAFKPETFWVIRAETETVPDKTSASRLPKPLPLICEVEPRKRSEVDAILKTAKASGWVVKDVTETEVKRIPRPPFITSTLQQTASSRLGFSPSRTMQIAQKLYEAGHITYMRTDSTTLSKQALGQIATVVEKLYGKDHLEFRTYAAKSKNAQEAHEAIRPTNLTKEAAGMNDEQKKLYRLIWQRTVASQMADAKTLRTKIFANVVEGKMPDFAANGSRILFPGWLKADPEAQGDEVTLPKVVAGDHLKLISIAEEEKQTEPPPRYTEAGLIKELEKRGIGRPSTYASIIRTIEEREYVQKVNKSLVPTDTGDVVSTFLEENFGHYINDSFTAEMEDKLDHIAEGTRPYEKTLKEFYAPFIKEVKAKEKTAKITTLGNGPKEFPCPECGSPMVIKLGRGGKFLSCERFPDCNGARGIDGKIIEKEKPIGTDPVSGLEVYLLDGRFGHYVQLGQKSKEHPKPRRASVPAGVNLADITLEMALKWLSLPRELGAHPTTSKMISASIGRFGPFIVHDGDFRSLKTDDVYTVTLERALQILAEPKKARFGRKPKAPAEGTNDSKPAASKATQKDDK